MEITTIRKTELRHSSESSFLDFSEAEILERWKDLPSDPNCYKLESAFYLTNRCIDGLTNFPNIGGNDQTRPQLVHEDEKIFVEANWITDQLIATGYPKVGRMRDHYWYMVHSLLQQKKTVFIVNFMHQDDLLQYGGWFFPTKENPSVEAKVQSWERKVSWVSSEERKKGMGKLYPYNE